MVQLWICSVLCLFTVTAVYGIHPPRIVKPSGNYWGRRIEYAKTNTILILECKAEANPNATYVWTLNGTDVNEAAKNRPGTIKYDQVSGNLTLGPKSMIDFNGYYQCFAMNSVGKAMTPHIIIRAAFADYFQGGSSDVADPVTVTQSDYAILTCEGVPASDPAWDFHWDKLTIRETDAPSKSDLVLGDRMVVDAEGRLHILWVENDDHNTILACAAYSKTLYVEARNTKSLALNVIRKPRIQDRAPQLVYNPDVTVNAGDDATLTCIFTYFSQIGEVLKVNWTFFGKVLGHGFHYHINNTQLPNETYNQEGEYRCEATLGDKTYYGFVNLKIIGPPIFRNKKSISSISVPVGDEAVFHCEPFSHNTYPPRPTWFRNTERIFGCMPGFFECRKLLDNGDTECYPQDSVCNRYPDCIDESDEANCQRACIENQKSCGSECIPKDQTCVPKTCEYPGFLCNDNATCLKKEEVCNGQDDCSDGSDERTCENQGYTKLGRFVFNSQRTELRLPNVTKQDMQCFQCMVTNQYGSRISDGCLTVIDKIVVKEGPNSTYYVGPGSEIEIEVVAVTDKQEQNHMKYKWYWYETIENRETGEEKTFKVELPTQEIAQFIRISHNGRHFQMLFPLVKISEKELYGIYNTMKDRTYSLVVSHSYDQVELNFTVIGEGLATPKPDPIVEAASTNLWFIALILAILILFIVVALIVCYMYRNRGGTYPLDKKEHQAGHDPEQELKNNGFHDVGRVDDDYDDKPHGEEASLSESVKPYESDDDPTEEYGGDFDVSKFNEDGSFIGLYGDKKSKYSSEAKEATV